MSKKGEATRKEIVDRALELFSVKGFYNTSMADILEATGLTKGGFYGHFNSKEALWFAAYDEAEDRWKGIVFKDTEAATDPLERLNLFLQADMRDYLGGNVFPGGCFFLNTFVELSGQSEGMSGYIRQGFEGTARMMERWLREAEEKGMLKPGLNLSEAAGFILITLNGAAALYAGTKDENIWKRTISQLRLYIDSMRRG